MLQCLAKTVHYYQCFFTLVFIQCQLSRNIRVASDIMPATFASECHQLVTLKTYCNVDVINCLLNSVHVVMIVV